MVEIIDWHGKSLRVAIGTDHGGFSQKAELAAWLETRGAKVIDCGPFSFDAADDYSDFGAPVARAIARGEAECGILICRSGVGMGILANRVHGVRAVVADNPELAKKSRSHNCSNVLVLPGDTLDFSGMKPVIESWFDTPFSGDERHVRRLIKLETNTYDDIAAVRAAASSTPESCFPPG